MPPVTCAICNGQKFKSESAYKQHVRDSVTHRQRAAQVPACTLCGGRCFKDWNGYSNHVRTSAEHKANLERASERSRAPTPGSSNPGSRPVSGIFGLGLAAAERAAERAASTSTVRPASPVGSLRSAAEQPKREATPQPAPVPAPTIRCQVCGASPVDEQARDEHVFADHPEVCCKACHLIFASFLEQQQHWRDSDAHPKCEYCPTAFPDSAAHFVHLAQAHSQIHAQHHDSLYEVANAHVAAPPIQAIYSQASSSDYSFRAPSPLSSCDVSDAPEHPEDVQQTQNPEPCDTPKSDVPEFQRGLGAELRPVSELVRAASEPPLSAVVPPAVASDETATDLEESTRSIVSQAASRPTTPSVNATQSQDLPSQRSPSSSASAKTSHRSESTWSVVSSPRSSTRYHSGERPTSSERRQAKEQHVSPERRSAEAPRAMRAVPVQPTGGTVASESSSGLATPVSAHSLIFSLTEQMAAHRIRLREPVTLRCAEEELLGSRRSSSHATPASAHSVLPSTRAPEAQVELNSAHAVCDDVTQTPRSRSVSRTRTSSSRPVYSSFEAAPTSTTHLDPSPECSASADALPTPKPRHQWHCRVCLCPPTNPTVTICGHLFCHRCIVAEMSKNLQCPVCRAVMLVRLDVAA